MIADLLLYIASRRCCQLGQRDAMQLQQLLAISAAAQVQRPFMEQNPLLQMSMMNSFGNEVAARMVNPGALSSDMMRRLQQEGGTLNVTGMTRWAIVERMNAPAIIF
uniref:Uncharacterized protein n=1 Tax=Parascaris equorum TaxID=6256 RepID=A0A914R8L2_PAREQ